MIRLLKAIILHPLGPEWNARHAAKQLSKLGHEQRRAHIRSTARQMRTELGLPPSKALGG